MPNEATPTPSIRQSLRDLLRGENLKEIWSNWKWIMTFTRRHWLGVVGLTFFGLLSSSLNLAAAIITKNLIASIISLDMDRLLPMVVLMVLCAALSVLFQSGAARYSARLSTTMHQEIQKLTFDRLVHGDWMAVRRFPTGDLLSRFSGDIGNIASCAMTFLPNVIVQLFTVLVTLGIIFYYDPIMALICLVSTPVLFLASRTLLRRQHAFNRRLRIVNSGMTAFQAETFRNIDTLKGFGIESAVSGQLEDWQKKEREMILEHNAFTIRTSALLSSMGTLVQYAAMGYCIWRLWQGHMILDTMTFFLQQRGTLQNAFSGLVGQIPRLLGGSVAAERIRELTDLPQDPDSTDELPTPWCRIRLENVSAAYEDGVKVLEDITLEAGPGEVIALVGPSGEGKTTLLRLLLGLMQPLGGNMELTDARGTVHTLGTRTRRYFSYVPQGNTLLAGSIADNLRLVDPNASDEQIIAALEGACAWDFVSQMPGGIHARLGEGGLGLSEGQAQRIAIARALMRKAPAMLLDEITSALDMETEQRVLSYLMNLGVTCIVSTHRPSVLTMCTRAYRVEDGHITRLTEEEIRNLTASM
ncbi:MAG: ABC transporter ATP-binding protein [Oscillospiraceae bacterium]|nr:ABC transporter ATP-binding protein [Oscillospiraceae bacterium]